MSDYRVIVKVQNGRIFEKIRAKGFVNVSQLCKAHGLLPSAVGNILNMKLSPINKDGGFRTVVIKLAEALGEIPEDLFTERQYEAVTSNVRDFLVDEQHIAQLLAPGIEHSMALIEMADGIQSRAGLNEQQQRVIDMRYKQDMTFTEVADAMGVSVARVRQVEEKAMRKMRAPGAVRDILADDLSA